MVWLIGGGVRMSLSASLDTGWGCYTTHPFGRGRSVGYDNCLTVCTGKKEDKKKTGRITIKFS